MTTVRRVTQMTWRELACRTRQQAGRWWDAVAPAFGPAGEPRRRWRPRHVPAAEPRTVFLQAVPHRFFAGAANLEGPPATTTGPGWMRELIDDAEAIAEGRFDLLGYQQLDFGTPIDWHLDAVSGRRSPLIHWSRINPLDAEAIGDSKVIWELNRHQWMVTLAQAYRLTRDERFAEIALARLEAWVQANPYPLGINWASSLEVSFRLIAWCWSLVLMRDARAMTPARFDAWQTLMRAHARHVERYLSYYYSPNTHLTGEALGLVYAGLVFAGCSDAARWRDTGRRVLLAELSRQVLSDGVHFEQATCYQRYTADIYLHLLILAARNRLSIPDDVRNAVHRLVRSLLAIMQPDHTLPNVGDADGGWLMPLSRRDPLDCRATFGVAALLFGDPELAWAADSWTPDVSWLLGQDAATRFDLLARRPPPMPPSQRLPEGGYVIMREAWRPDAHQLILDAGPLGCTVSGAHGHADLLSVQCWAFGEPFIVDPGTFRYAGDDEWRNHFRTAAAHSTVLVDGRPHAEPAAPFAWRQRPRARLVTWESTSDYDLADATHDAYATGPEPVTHRRRVLYLKPGAWLLIDDLSGAGTHAADVRFQFSPRVVTFVDDEWVAAEGAGGRSLWLCSWAAVPLERTISQGQTDPIAGWVSTDYGVRHPAPLLVVHAPRWSTSVRVLTLLVPVAQPVDAPRVTIERDMDGVVTGVGLADDHRFVHFDHASLWIEHRPDWRRSA